MSKRKLVVLAIMLALTFQVFVPSSAYAYSGTRSASTWYAVWEANGNDWKVVFVIPSSVRNYYIYSVKNDASKVLQRCTSTREWLGNGSDKIVLTCGFRSRLYVGYETIPWSNLRLGEFAQSSRIYYWD